MATQQEITKIEEQSEELVNNLEELHQQVGSFRTAKDELQKVSNQLLALIDGTKKLSEESHKIIEIINRIGSSKIFERLENIEKKTKNYFIILASAVGMAIVLQIVFFFLKK
ncbi:MAG: hypothetical protein WD988_02165 [Candidatus Curtissbacteria bacterium]